MLLKLLPLSIIVYNQFKHHTQHMFQNQNNNHIDPSFNQQPQHFGLLEKSQLIHHSNHIEYFHNAPLQNNFEEIFLTDFAPNWSNVSVCTQEDRNFETFLIGDDCLGESVDHFFNDHQEKQPIIENQNHQQGSNIQRQEKLLQQNSETVKSNNTNLQGQKQEQSQSCHDQTKNIPKNYIKAIFAFILEEQSFINRLVTKLQQSQTRFIDFIREQKKIKKYTIQRLKSLWTDIIHGKLLRIISSQFLRKRSLGYIFGSKIEKKMGHVRHRLRFIRAIQNPAQFNNIK